MLSGRVARKKRAESEVSPVLVRIMCALALLTLTSQPCFAAPTPAPKPPISPQAQGTEIAFVASIQKDLMARFSTPDAAVKAGYFRYTNEDEDGAISYANLHWLSGNPTQPSQLWYDVKGNLLGADFSVLQSSSPEPPKVWGVDFRRWHSFREHIHYVLAGPNGTEKYGGIKAEKFAAAGGNVDNPQPATLVKMGIAKSIAGVKHIFLFPSIWDLIVWVKTNPDGAFAGKNPLVTPTATAGTSDE
jgi:hypothetical protein